VGERIRLGVDLGGTKIEIAALDSQGGELLRRRTATPQGDYAGTLKAIVDLVAWAESQLGTTVTVGVGTPGAISTANGRLKNSNSVVLNGKPLLQDLEQALERPIRLANDANCFALSEATDGAAAGAPVVFGVILGTGTGGGVVVHGQILTGRNAIAGEWGHNPLPWPGGDELPGPTCYCGKHGCIETFLSGPGMAQDHARTTGEELDSQVIAVRAAEGDLPCRATLTRYSDRLARSLAHVINILDPDVIVLGGGMSNMEELYRSVPLRWGKYVFSDRVDARLVRNRFGDSSGVRGAAWLWD
jgi:fructokinase